MKKILTGLAFISVSLFAQAQSARQVPQPYTGNFEIIKNTEKGEEHINVNYVLTNPPFTTVLNMHLNTPDPMMLSAKILNVNSETVMNWMPSQKNSRYTEQFDISNLSVGKYKIEIYGPDGKKAYTIDFEKQGNTSSGSGSSSTSK